MSDSGLPSQFVNDIQDEENFDNSLDLELFGDDAVDADFDGDQALNVPDQTLNVPDESINQQDVAPSGTPGVHEQQQEDPSNPSNPAVEPSFNFDEWLESQDFVSGPANGIIDNGDGGQSRSHEDPIDLNQSQVDLTVGGNQPQFSLDDPSVGPPSSIGQLADGLTNLEQVPEFNFDAFDAEEWQNYANTGAEVDIADILAGTSSNHVEAVTASRQQSSVPTPAADSGYGTAPMSRQPTRGQTPATPNQGDNAVGRPGPSNVQGISNAPITGARHPLAEEYAVTDDESESSSVSNDLEYETYRKDDPLIVEDPPQEKWGRTGQRNGQQVWFNPETQEWQPSASHHDMRATLIARAQAEYPEDRYLHPDPTDGLPHGETAFFKPHQNRGPDRHQCADELFVWREYQSKKDENGKPLRKKPNVNEHPGFMFEGDRILLDPRNNPVVDHKFIPLTLSVHTDGGKLQEMALQPGCRQVDCKQALERLRFLIC